MKIIWEKIVNVWGKFTGVCNKAWIQVVAHKAISITVAAAVAASGAGFGGFEIYQHLTDTPEEDVVVAEVEDEEVATAPEVEYPEFKSVHITTESIEKDITIYISDSDDNCIEGYPFEVKLIDPDDLESLEPYITAIQDINKEIEDLTGESDLDTGESVESTEDSDSSDSTESATSESSESVSSDKSSSESASDASSESTSSKGSNSGKKSSTKTAKSTESSESSEDSESSESTSEDSSESEGSDESESDEAIQVTLDDPTENLSDEDKEKLVQLYEDKKVAMAAYAVALDSADGTVYVDEDMDGIIKESDVEPGDFVASLVYDDTAEVNYDPVSYATSVNVKDEIEYKVVKEVTKEIKKDVASEDGQKAADAATTVEATLSDTVEFVESSVNEKKHYEATTSVKDPGKTFTATKTSTKGDTSDHDIKYFILEATINYVDSTGTSTGTKQIMESYFAEDSTYTINLPTEAGYTCSDTSPVTGTMTGNLYITFDYVKNADSSSSSSSSSDSSTSTSTSTDSNTSTSTSTNSDSSTSTSSDSSVSDSSVSDSGSSDDTSVGSQSGRSYVKSASTSKTSSNAMYKKTEEAKLKVSFSGDTFTLSGTKTTGTFTVNGNAISGSTYTVTDAGEYTFGATAHFTDGVERSLSCTYKVETSTDTTAQLYDTEGRELYLDSEGKTKATVGDYKAGQTYYYEVSEKTYYGWQSINGNTYYYDKNGKYVTGTQVIQGVSYNFGSDGVLMVNGTGVDVSKYQGNIDWSSASSAVSFAIVRCGYRGKNDGALHEDPYFYKNMKNAKANGVATGVYIYSTALNEAEAVQEASMAVSMANAAGGCSYPIYIDMEDTARGVRDLSQDQKAAIINAFVATVQSAGYKAGVYANKTWLTKYINASAIPSSASVWVAQYNTSCTYSGRYTMWQFSSKGSIPGISGNVDVNKSYF